MSSNDNRKYIRLVFFTRNVFKENIYGKGFMERHKQPDQAIKFDTLVSHFDISEIINKAIEEERITDDYRFQTYGQLRSEERRVGKEWRTWWSPDQEKNKEVTKK